MSTAAELASSEKYRVWAYNPNVFGGCTRWSKRAWPAGPRPDTPENRAALYAIARGDLE